MEELNRSKLKEIRNLIESLGENEVEKRIKVVKFFWRAGPHVSSDELTSIISSSNENIEKDFVEETLLLLSKLGLAHAIEFENEPRRYETRYLGDHHDHMICIECGKIIEFEDPGLERIQDSVAEKYGFSMIRHRMEFYGFCDSCASVRGNEIFLKDAKTGEMLEVLSLNGGSVLNKKCASMGIIKNSVVEVLNSNKGGQVIIGSGGSRYVLGKGITEKIRVKRIAQEKCTIGEKASCPYSNELEKPAAHMCMGDSVPMSFLKSGDKGVVTKVGGCMRFRKRLYEMGLLNGTGFEIVKYAPLKDPLEMIVKGCHISLRVDEAKHIMVKRI